MHGDNVSFTDKQQQGLDRESETTQVSLINTLVTSGLFHPYHLEESTFIFMSFGCVFFFFFFSFLFHFSMKNM